MALIQLLRASVCFSLAVLLLVAAIPPVIRNAASLQFIKGYFSQNRAMHWLQAESLQRSAVNLHDMSTEESARLAEIMAALGRTEEAVSLWRAIGQPFAPFFLLEVGNSLWQKGERTQALAYWQTVPDTDVYFGIRGLVYERAGDIAAALDNYQISWMINDRALPSKGEFLVHSCELLRRQGDVSQAIAACDRARESGNSFWSNLILGMLYLDQRDFTTAEAYLRQALAEGPSYTHAYLYLGLSLANQGKLLEAMQFYRQGLVLDPNNGWLNYLMAKALWGSGQTDDAQEYLKRSIQFVPDSWESAYLDDAQRLLSQPRQ